VVPRGPQRSPHLAPPQRPAPLLPAPLEPREPLELLADQAQSGDEALPEALRQEGAPPGERSRPELREQRVAPVEEPPHGVEARPVETRAQHALGGPRPGFRDARLEHRSPEPPLQPRPGPHGGPHGSDVRLDLRPDDRGEREAEGHRVAAGSLLEEGQDRVARRRHLRRRLAEVPAPLGGQRVPRPLRARIERPCQERSGLGRAWLEPEEGVEEQPPRGVGVQEAVGHWRRIGDARRGLEKRLRRPRMPAVVEARVDLVGVQPVEDQAPRLDRVEPPQREAGEDVGPQGGVGQPRDDDDRPPAVGGLGLGLDQALSDRERGLAAHDVEGPPPVREGLPVGH
jgi:hypothetical protein